VAEKKRPVNLIDCSCVDYGKSQDMVVGNGNSRADGQTNERIMVFHISRNSRACDYSAFFNAAREKKCRHAGNNGCALFYCFFASLQSNSFDLIIEDTRR